MPERDGRPPAAEESALLARRVPMAGRPTEPVTLAGAPGLPPELPALARFAERLVTADRRPSAGAAAGLAVALAVDLVAQVAERSPGWEARAGILAQADVLRERATSAAGRVAIVYHRLVEALDAAVAVSDGALGAGELREQLAEAADALIDIAETACDCGALAVIVARSGDTVVRADATAAAILAAAGAEMAAHLVEVNLLASADRALTDRAAVLARAAAKSRSAALAVLV
jgi:formiminotetrahydrofolate cyclodeaminase